MNVLITGGTGLVGSRLTTLLLERGHRVRHLSRTPAPAGREQRVETFLWDPAAGKMDAAALARLDAIVHLAGASVANGRWSQRRKRQILDSRVASARLLHDTLAASPWRVAAFVSASATGYYGQDTGDRWLTEDSPSDVDFLSFVTQQWEKAADTFATLGARVVKLRVGVVLSPEGGALPRLALPVRFGVGAAVGSGQQYLSWVHLDDLARVFVAALEQPAMKGSYNAVAPEPVTNAEFTRTLAQTLNRPLLLPRVPGVALRMALGEMAGVVLGGNRVSARKLADAGFDWRYPQLPEALQQLLSGPKQGQDPT